MRAEIGINVSFVSFISNAMSTTRGAERKAYQQCFKILRLLCRLDEEYADLRSKALKEPAYFDTAVIRFSRMLSRVKRLIKEFITTYEVSPILEFNLDKGTLALGFKGVSRSLTPMKPLQMHPTLLRDLLEGMPKPGEITAMIDRRIRTQLEKEEQKSLRLVSRFDSHIMRVEKEERELLSPAEASAMLGNSPKTLWRWWKEGKIQAVRLPSRRLRYPRKEVERILHSKPTQE